MLGLGNNWRKGLSPQKVYLEWGDRGGRGDKGARAEDFSLNLLETWKVRAVKGNDGLGQICFDENTLETE